MSMTSFREMLSRESAIKGGFVDAIGGIATIVLAVLGLAGVRPILMIAIATMIFGVALLIQGGTMLSEYTRIIFPPGAKVASVDQFGGNSLSTVFLVGAAGIVLGILALARNSRPRLLRGACRGLRSTSRDAPPNGVALSTRRTPPRKNFDARRNGA